METAGLPLDIQEKLRCLEIELAEGDITQQGFEKKKAKLLAPYFPSLSADTAASGSSSLGRSSSPYNPGPVEQRERTAAVIAALETNRLSTDEQVPMSFRRNTATVVGMNFSVSPSQSFETSSQDSGGSSQTGTPLHATSPPPPTMPKTSAVTQRQQQLHQTRQVQPPSEGPPGGAQGAAGVSHKIQQLLNTLKRPKKNRKPMEQYYTDNADDDEVMPSPDDPAAPRPVGPMMQPISGVPLESRQDWHRNLEAAIQHHSSTLGKYPAISTVDSHGKVSVACTYNKLAAKAQKVAYFLLNKLGSGKLVQPGDRIALVFKTDEAASFAIAFWGCIFAAVIPVAIQPPITKDDPGGQQVGFLLNSLNVTVAITSELTGKQLPKEEGKDHIGHFKGWPRLSWFFAEHLPRVPRDWSPPPRPSPDSTAYIEFTTDKEGSALGVSVTRSTLLTHCRVLTTACHYKGGEVLICTEDPKQSIGLWHGIMAAAYSGLHVVFVPPYVMITLPTVWLHMVNKHKASCVLTSSKSLSRCISLAQHKELRDLKLDCLRMILLDDGANPWSLASSDLFFEAFSPKGLTREVICPCAGSPETLTVSLRRPSPNTPSGRGVMSISGLSYGVVRVEEAGSITSLTLQDVGLVMPGARIAVVKPTGLPILCKTDEIGEVCLEATSCGNSYWGLQGKTNQTFKAQLLDENERVVSNAAFVRSGFLGFVGEGGLVFICGTMNGLIQVAGRRHNMEDLIATVMAVEPHGFIYKERVIVFSVSVLKGERVVVVGEQKPNCSDEEAFTWMNSVVPAVESIHGINLYGIVLVGPGRLPKYPNGVVHVQDTKYRFIEGTLHPINLLMCPYQSVTNLPVPKQAPVVTGAAQIMGDLVTGRAMESEETFLSSGFEDENTGGAPTSEYLVDMLRWRASSRPDDQLFSLMDTRGHVVKSLNSSQLLKRAERIGATLIDKFKLNSGDIVAIIFPPGLDLIVAFYGCLSVGIAPVVIKPPAPSNLSGTLPAMKLTVGLSTARAVLTSHNIIRLFKSKEAAQVIDVRSLPPLMDIEDISRKKLDRQYRPPTAELISYLDFNISTTGVLSGVKVSHSALYSMCKALKSLMELYPSREVALCLDPYSGFGLVLWCVSGIYSGHSTYLINPYDLEQNPLLWLTVLSSNKIRDTYCSYSVIDLCCRELGSSIEALKSRNVALSSLRSCVIVSEERPRVHLLNSFTTLFNLVGLDYKSVSTAFGCRVNPVICLQGPRQPETDCVYVDGRALRMDRVVILERGSPNSLCLMESGKILPDGRVTIVNVETKMPCPHTDLGEIWVSSPHNGSGYYSLNERVNDSLTHDHFKSRLGGGGDVSVEYARTGYLGFMLKSEKTDQSAGANHYSLYVVGSLDESLNIRGFRYHPSDLEASIIRSHKNISGSVVFLSNKLLVVVAELHGDENEALDIVPVITTTLLEEHQVVTGIIVVVDPGIIPINSRGEKQRINLRDSFLADELDPIYVAYNL